MKIKFTNPYKSIHQFDEAETPEFCVLVGINGAGKTHLLKAIEGGHVQVDMINKERITYFNLQSFLIKNQKAVTARNIEDEKDQAWTVIEENRTNARFNDNEEQTRGLIQKVTRGKIKQRCLIETGIYLSGKKLSELDKSTFLNYAEFQPDDYELLESLSEICFDHRRKYIFAQLPFEQGGEGKTIAELAEIEMKSPWNFINQMFETFGLPHRIKAPPFNAGDIIKTGNTQYAAMPIYDDLEIGFEDLSSGERILCALAITVFQDQQTANFPELLLLDEIDASLHPSMVKNLLSVINDVFIKNSCKVILATHSPTTASLIQEESLFEVRQGNAIDKIVKISQIKAIEILSEGMMTLEKGIKLFDQISTKPLSIITEGNNIAHLKKAIDILKPALQQKIEFVTGAEGSSGMNQLKTLFDFFKLVPHTNSVLFVFDCDVNMGSRAFDNNTYFFVLPRNSHNSLAGSGIENIYPELMFTGFIKTIEESNKTVTKMFDPKRKSDFATHIIASTASADFANYTPLVTTIESILR